MQQAGWLNVWKPAGVGTRAIANILQTILPGAMPRWAKGPNKTPKAGHVGTLDTAAAGVVPMALGGATRLIPYLPTAKSYDAVVKLGLATTSDDLSGVVVAQSELSQPEASAAAAAAPGVLNSFVGSIMQQAPNLSAVWIDGRRAYKMALEAARENAGSGGVAVAKLPLVTPHRRVLVRRISVGSWCTATRPSSAPAYPVPQAHTEASNGGSPTMSFAARVRGTGRSLLNNASTPIFQSVCTSAMPPQLKVRERLSWQGSRVPRLLAPGGTEAAPVEDSPVPLFEASPPAPSIFVSPPLPPPLGCGYPELHLSVDCGPGVYIRSIARDLGTQLGVPATLAGLTRTSASGFNASTAVHMLDLRESWVRQLSIASDLPFRHLPAVALGRLQRKDLLHLFVRRVPKGFLPLPDGGTAKARGGGGGSKAAEVTEEESVEAEDGSSSADTATSSEKKVGPPPAQDWSIKGWSMSPVTPRQEGGKARVAVQDEGDVNELVHIWRQTTQALLPATVIQGPPTPTAAEELVAGYVNDSSNTPSSVPITPRIASGLDLGYVRVYAAVAIPGHDATDSVTAELLESAGAPGCLDCLALGDLEEQPAPTELLPSRAPTRPALVASFSTTEGVSAAASSARWVFLGLARVVPSSALYPQAAARLQLHQEVDGTARPDIYIMRAVTVI